METIPVTVVETPPFQRHVAAIWSDAERAAFIDHIARNPEAGDEIIGTGGVRKIRWGRKGVGKRGGARVIYFYYDQRAPIFLLAAYTKSDKADLSADEKRAIARIAEALKQTIRAAT